MVRGPLGAGRGGGPRSGTLEEGRGPFHRWDWRKGERIRPIRDGMALRRQGADQQAQLLFYGELRVYLDGLLEEHFGGGGYGSPATVSSVIDAMKRDEAIMQLGGPAAETVRAKLDEFLEQYPTQAPKTVRVLLDKPYSAEQVVDAGERVERNVAEFRDALRNFIRVETSPYF